MRTHVYICVAIFIWLIPELLSGQGTYAISGKVADDNKIGLIGCHVHADSSCSISDENGNFRFEGLKPGTYEIVATYVGFDNFKKQVVVKNKDVLLNISLKPANLLLEEIEVSGDYSSSGDPGKGLTKEVVDEQFLRENRSGSLMKSLEKIPGVSSIAIGSGNSKPVIRGMGFNRVVVVENNMKHEGQQWGADHGLEIDQYAVERLEIIKGPSSLAFGSDAIAGVLNLKQSFVPEQNSTGGELDLDYRSNSGLLGGSASLFGRGKSLYFKSRLTYLNYSDYKVPTDSIEYNSYYFVLDNNRLRNTAGREADFFITGGYIKDNVNSVLTISNAYHKSGFFANAHGLEIRNSQIDYDESYRDIDLPYQKVNHLKVNSKTNIDKDGHQVNLVFGYQNNFRQEFSEPVPHGYMPQPSDSLERQFNKNTASLNASWQLPEVKKQEITIGINSEFQHNRIGGWGFIIPDFEQFTGGLYFIDNINFSPSLILQAGIRYDFGHLNIQQYTDWFPSPIVSNGDTLGYEYVVRAPNMSRAYNSFTWSVGLVKNSPNATIKVNIGKSFRMPNAKELAADGINYHLYRYEKGNQSLNPEVSYQLDAGYEWKTKRTLFNVAVFGNYFPNYIYLNPTYEYEEGMQVYQYTQAEVHRYGGEVKLDYYILSELTAGLALEYVYSEQLSGSKKGFTLPFSPPPSVLIELKYSPVLKGIWNETYFSLDYSIVAAQNNIVPPEQKTAGYQLVNFGMGTDINLKNQTITVNVQVQNLFDITYYNHTSYYRLINVPEPGRNFIIGLKIPF